MADASMPEVPSRRRSRVAWWRSPPDQPGWVRPALLVVTAVAVAAYGWRMGGTTEIFYAAADRSMSSSWHDFFFAAFDPAGTISLDKLPGAFWVQALSVRAFGAHTWAVALPQVIEGALSVLVLFRAVRRCVGVVAGIVAAAVLATAPATVTLDRGNVADTLLVLLLVLAADAAVTAVHLGRPRRLLVAGLWVGLAFQAKMVEAWLVVPVLFVLYVLVGSDGLTRRVGWAVAMVAVAAVVSCSWMAAVSLTPRPDRPYVDGTTNDSVVSQVFDYNGFGRVDRLSPNQVLGRTLGIPFLAAPPPPASATRLFEGAPGRDTGWLLPASGLAVPALLWVRRRQPRTDMVRAAVVLWGAWLLVFAVVFSVSAINGYYLGALSPPVAALVGIGASLVWTNRRARAVQGVVAAFVVLTVLYAAVAGAHFGHGRPRLALRRGAGARHPHPRERGSVRRHRSRGRWPRHGAVRGSGDDGGARGGVGVGGDQRPRFLRHPVPATDADGLQQGVLRCPAAAHRHPARHRARAQRGSRPAGRADVGRDRPVHLRHRPGGASDRGLRRGRTGAHAPRSAHGHRPRTIPPCAVGPALA